MNFLNESISKFGGIKEDIFPEMTKDLLNTRRKIEDILGKQPQTAN